MWSLAQSPEKQILEAAADADLKALRAKNTDLARSRFNVVIGHEYLGGLNRPQDLKMAALMYAREIALSLDATYSLALLYQHGNGAPIDVTRAIVLFTRAVERVQALYTDEKSLSLLDDLLIKSKELNCTSFTFSADDRPV